MSVMKKWILIGCAAILVGIIIFTCAFSAVGFDISKISTLPPFEEKTEVVESTNQNIIIKDRNVPVKIKKSNDDKIHFDYFVNERENYDINLNGDLTFTKESHYKWYDYIFNINFKERFFAVSLPENYNGNITASTDNGAISLNGITANELKLHTSNGNYTVENIKSDKLSVDTNNGYIYLGSAEINNNIEISTSNGDVEQYRVNSKNMIVKTNNGKIMLSGTNVNGNAYFDTNNQDITFSNLSVKGDLKFFTQNGKINGDLLEKMSDFSITSSTSNGKNNLPANVSMGPQKMDVRSSNGDINIQFAK